MKHTKTKELRQTPQKHGLDFYTYSFTIYTPDGSILLRQIIYSRLINGFDFGVNTNYTKDKYRDEILETWRNSKFKINN